MNFERLRSEFLDNELRINYKSNSLEIINYGTLDSFDNNKILITNDKKIIVTGSNLIVSRLLIDELLIEGNIEKLEFR